MIDTRIETNWSLCFICQETKTEKTRSTSEGIKTVSKNMVELHKYGELRAVNIHRISTSTVNGEPNVEATLLLNSAIYHPNCRSNYKTRTVDSAKEKAAKAASNVEEENGPTTRKRTPVDAGMGSSQCCICSKIDDGSNLHAAGMFHAKKKKPDNEHIRKFTEKLREMARAVNNTFLINKLQFRDVKSEEVYYHGDCLKRLEWNSKSVTMSKADNTSEQWIKALAFDRVVTYIYECHREERGVIFNVKALEKRYIDDLATQGITVASHTTNFSKRLTDAIDGLVKKSVDKVECTVSFDETIDGLYWQHRQSPQNFITQLRTVVGQIREDIFQKVNKFDGNFDEDTQVKSVPTSLLTLISFLIDGECNNVSNYSQATLTTAQIITSNCRKKKRKTLKNTSTHNSSSRETPFVIYTSLKIYATFSSRALIDKFFQLGICVSYTRVLEIMKYLYEKLRSSFSTHNTFIPHILRKDLFTVLAKDNIDKNAASTHAKSHYHGTSISILQFPTSEFRGTDLPSLPPPDKLPSSNKLAPLPKEYTVVQPLPYHPDKDAPLFYSVSKVNQIELSVLDKIHDTSRNDEVAWLDAFEFTLAQSSSSPKAWSQHHSQFMRCKDQTPGCNAIMPLLRDPVHTLQMQVHCMKINQSTVKALNPEQTPVDVSDLPVFALTKEALLRFGELFPQYFPMMGALHIEQVFLICHGQLILGSGLPDILKISNLSLLGTSAIVDVNDIKRARYCIQVSVASLYMKLKDACRKDNSEVSPMKWLSERSKSSDMCFYWDMVLRMQLDILVFVRSMREGNFNAYVASIRRLLKWVFVFDHIHYARWLSVHLFDLTTLEKANPDLHAEMMKGKFSFQKSQRMFSKMALDQVHEQNNKIIKGAGGASQLLNRSDDSALIRWETCGPEVARIVAEFEETIELNGKHDGRESKKHHEDTPTFQKNFAKDVKNLYDKIQCNPFELNDLTMINNNSVVFSTDVLRQVKKIETEGESQVVKFAKERLVMCKTSIKATIPKSFNTVLNTDLKTKRTTESISVNTLNKLKSAAAYRPRQVETLFSSELQGVTQSLAADSSTLYHGNKAKMKDRFEPCIPPPLDGNSAIIIELSPIIFRFAQRNVSNFQEFATVIYYHLMELGARHRRIDVVCDRYFENSLKEQTRSGRGVGSKIVFNGDTPFPENFRDDFLHHSENKNSLNEYLAEELISMHHISNQQLIVTYKDGILSSGDTVSSHRCISNCTSEEADAKAVRHARDAATQGFSSIIVRTIDTDVLVLLIAHASSVTLVTESSIFAAMYSTDNNVTYYDINGTASKLGEHTVRALPFFYAFTGCDTTSSIFGKGKCKCWDIWHSDERKDEITSVLVELGSKPLALYDRQVDVLEYFVKKLYATTSATESLARERASLFERSTDNDLRKIPMSRHGLIQHTKRSCLQAGYLWRECFENIVLPDPLSWGWILQDGKLVPRWQDVDTANLSSVLKTCHCTKKSCTSCSCSKEQKMPCLPMCFCRRSCNNK